MGPKEQIKKIRLTGKVMEGRDKETSRKPVEQSSEEQGQREETH